MEKHSFHARKKQTHPSQAQNICDWFHPPYNILLCEIRNMRQSSLSSLRTAMPDRRHPSIFFPFSHLPLFLSCLTLCANVSSIPFSRSNALSPFSCPSRLSRPSRCSHLLSHTIRLVSLPDHLELKRCQSCLAASCLWSSFPLRSADEASARKIP